MSQQPEKPQLPHARPPYIDLCKYFVDHAWDNTDFHNRLLTPQKTFLIHIDLKLRIGLLAKFYIVDPKTKEILKDIPKYDYAFQPTVIMRAHFSQLAGAGTFGKLMYWLDEGCYVLFQFILFDTDGKEDATKLSGPLENGAEWPDIENFITTEHIKELHLFDSRQDQQNSIFPLN
ncbi:hypothetical protein DM02DRAFT_631683 [Periconia macrospinosa]|uniref:Uncharacterized protein n=1 Tax=Periconia macrospinosa TaxID=97972 RepID=A0A2V1DF67_9PLEO|nr:hypothetical protein DM02DRAFT_631683 [Periconia macrospinosa]